MKKCLLSVLVILLLCCVTDHAKASGKEYYKSPPQFHYTPDPTAARTIIGRLGPIGLGLELRQPAFTMFIMNVEDGSPAAATGKLKPGQMIESINGEVLKDIDPRVQLGNMITQIEATDGVVRLMIRDEVDSEAYPVVFKIPVLGAYSETWPLSCKKSDTIVREFADWLGQQKTLGWGAALFLLSTGEDQDLEVVRRHFRETLSNKSIGHPWAIGYTGPAVCEYYLRTGDKSVLLAIQASCDYLKRTIYNGAWMGRGGANYGYMAGGHMNAAGVHCLTFLLMAKECGVDVDDHTLQSALIHYFRFAGRGNVPYGDGTAEDSFTDNGRVGGLAFAMAAAANLTPEGEDSVYAKARDISATKSFYSTSWLFHGHTGGGIGELWRGPAMGLVKDKRREQYRTFMDERRWMYELARTHEGSFGWADGQNVSYTRVNDGGKPCGNYIPLVYTLPRQNLRLYGAPPTEYSHSYKLPKRPWGTAADDAFYSLEAGNYAPGKGLDVSTERLRTDASQPIFVRIGDPDVADEVLMGYALHIDNTIRSSAAGKIAALGRDYLLIPLLTSHDPRGRLSGLTAIKRWDKSTAENVITDEMYQRIAGMIEDPEESWFVVETALEVLAEADPELIYAHVDRLAYWLEHDEWWLRRAALIAVTPIAIDERCYKKVMPIVAEMISANERAVALDPVKGFVARLQEASPEVQQFGVETLANAYQHFPDQLYAPGGQNMANGTAYLLKQIASYLSKAPNGFDALYQVSRKRFPEQSLPHKHLYMDANSESFGPAVKEVFKPLVLNNLIPKYMAEGNHIASNKEYLRKEANSIPVTPNYYYREPRMDGLVELYPRVGNHDYDWREFGPGLTNLSWAYFSFDPPEQKLWTPGWRYREVTLPKGMASWFDPAFDAAAAGWKVGHAPFGHFDGKLPEGGGCSLSFCRCGEPSQTFWEKEVLLVRTKLTFPPLREGHRYRICIGGMSHVNRGDGYELYLNGRLIKQRDEGIGKRQGGRPECYYITNDDWPDFEKEVTIAAKAFLNIPPGKRSSGFKANVFSVFLEEMKVPPLTDDLFRLGEMLMPMRCTAWQATKDDVDLYRWDGDFEQNAAVVGSWIQIGQVERVDAFESAEDLSVVSNSWLQTVTLHADGSSGHDGLAWSGDILMDLQNQQALAMTTKTIAGVDYLLIEAGGFSRQEKKGYEPDHPANWSPPYMVMKHFE